AFETALVFTAPACHSDFALLGPPVKKPAVALPNVFTPSAAAFPASLRAAPAVLPPVLTPSTAVVPPVLAPSAAVFPPVLAASAVVFAAVWAPFSAFFARSGEEIPTARNARPAARTRERIMGAPSSCIVGPRRGSGKFGAGR